MIRKIIGRNLEKSSTGLFLLKIRRDFTDFLGNYRYTRLVSIFKMWKLKDKYKGKRCFIIGNGPSLKKTKLSLLKNEYTFGLNRIYLMFDEMGFQPSFYVCMNNLVIDQTHKDINRLSMPKFISIRSNKKIKFDTETIFLKSIDSQALPFNPTEGVWEGATVTYVAMQLAYYMGFSEVILVGVDHSFETKGTPHKVVVSKGDDKDHFNKNYFGKGFRWQLPGLETSEIAYRIADYVFQEDGREILDATVDGKLDVFPKIKLEKLFE